MQRDFWICRPGMQAHLVFFIYSHMYVNPANASLIKKHDRSMRGSHPLPKAPQITMIFTASVNE